MKSVEDAQVEVFKDGASTAAHIERARHIVLALKEIEGYINTVLTDEKIFDKTSK
jgi:hypothetical protein